MEKSRLRRRIRAERNALPQELLASAGRGMCRLLAGTDEWRRAESVFLFLSMRGEPDTGVILAQAEADGKRIFVPRVRERMEIVEFCPAAPTVPGPFGIPEPESGRVASADEIDLAIVPCIAAGEDGARMGQGGGYYDRFLAEFPGDAVMLVMERFLLPPGAMPEDAWDRRVGTILTEKRIIRV